MQQQTQELSLEEKIDEAVFEPLSKLLLETPFHPNHQLTSIVTNIIRQRNSSDVGNYKGLILETFIKQQISTLVVPGLFTPAKFTSSTFQGDYLIDIDDFGNVRVSPTIALEIDALYEYTREGVVTPVIFEISFKDGSTGFSLKHRTLQRVYGTVPYFCKIRPQTENEPAGLIKNGEDHDAEIPYFRKILIPRSSEYANLAEKLSQARQFSNPR